MHPALSVIFFTVMSGAGFGFMAFIGSGIAMPQGPLAPFLICSLAGSLCVSGLISSTFHLGHPERAWRAFSQWRTSWLSREGVVAVATLAVFGVYTLIWMITGERNQMLGVLITIGAILTVYSTAMIYGQLKTVPQWNSAMTPVCYLLFAGACGLCLTAAIGTGDAIFGVAKPVACLLMVLISWGAKFIWWQNGKGNPLAVRGSSTATATGLGFIGKVRLFEKPHSGENYLTKEMVHKIGRKHAHKLRVISLVLGLFIPALFLVISLAGVADSFGFIVAFVSLIAGLFVERWLFFAEAKHVVSLYY